jgi:zinc protease
MKLADVKQVYASFGPQRAALVAVGGAKAEDVVKALRSEFGGWRARAATAPAPTAQPASRRPRLVLVDFPGKPQSVVMVGQPSAPRSSPDYLALEVMNAILGGSFTSRLNQNLREQHGYTYGAGSTFAWGSRFSPFFARSSVKTDVTGPALGEMLKELKTAAQLDESELAKGRALLAFNLAEQMSHATALATAVGEIWLFGLPRDELRTYVPRLRALTADAVQAATKRALDAEQMTVVIAGDRAKVEPQLTGLSLGPADLRDPSGDPVANAPSSAGR